MNCNFVWFNLPKQVKEKVINVPKGWFMLVQELNIHLDYLKATYPEHYATIFIPKYKITWWGLVFRDLPKLCQFYDTLPPPIINRFEYVTGTAPTLQDFETTIGFTLLNGVKTGDVITFDNVGYSIPNEAFIGNYDIINVKSSATSTLQDCFVECINLISADFPNLINGGDGTFRDCNSLSSLTISSLIHAGDSFLMGCTSLPIMNFSNIITFGNNVSDNNVFAFITGKTITVTAKAIHQTSNNGNLEGDLQYLADNNNVTFIWV